MRASVEREKVRFVSGDAECWAWHYPGTNRGCVIMAGGFGVTKEPGTDRFARRFNEAGFAVLAFDFRHLGESGGQPRQVIRINEQLADWQAAIAFAAGRPDVDADRLAIWSFSLTGGQVFDIASRSSKLAAAIAQSPLTDGLAVARNAQRHQRPLAMLRFGGRGIRDALGSLVDRPPRLVPLVARPGTVALLTTPDSLDSDRALEAGRYPAWQQAVATRSALRASFYRPGRHSADAKCPVLVVVCEQDQAVLAAPAVRAARRAPLAELVQFPGGHYAPFLDAHEQAVEAELSFLRRHLLAESDVDGAVAACDGGRA